MNFRPEAVRGFRSQSGFRSGLRSAGGGQGGDALAGDVTYRLARNAVVAEFRKGRLSRQDVCDAHPDLVRAGRGVGEATSELCPICEETNVVLISYAFGPGLPASGRLISSSAELTKAGRTASGDVACYVVEVCPECSWNHLAQTFVVTKALRKRAALVRSAGSGHAHATPEEAPQA